MLNLIDFLTDLQDRNISQIEATNLLYSEMSHKKIYVAFKADYEGNHVVENTLNEINVKITAYKAYIYQKLGEI